MSSTAPTQSQSVAVYFNNGVNANRPWWVGIKEGRAIVATLSEASTKSGKSSPGTRGKQMSMLRSLFIEAQEFRAKQDAKANPKPAESVGKENEKEAEPIARNLRLESLVEVLAGRKALLELCRAAPI